MNCSAVLACWCRSVLLPLGAWSPESLISRAGLRWGLKSVAQRGGEGGDCWASCRLDYMRARTQCLGAFNLFGGARCGSWAGPLLTHCSRGMEPHQPVALCRSRLHHCYGRLPQSESGPYPVHVLSWGEWDEYVTQCMMNSS